MTASNKLTNNNDASNLIIAFALVEPFHDIPETNGRDESEDDDLTGSEPIDDPLERDNLEIGEVQDPAPVKDDDLEDPDLTDPLEEGIDDDDYAELDEDDDDYIDLDDEDDEEDDLDPSADDLGKQADYIDSRTGIGTDLRDGTTII